MTSTLLLLIGLIASSDEGNIIPESANILSESKFQAGGSVGEVHVLIRKDGHLDGQPYIVEVRPNCGKKSNSWKDVEALDSESACYVVPGSVKFDSKRNKILVKIHAANANAYNVETLKGMKSITPQCNTSPKNFEFDLNTICK